VDKCEINKF